MTILSAKVIVDYIVEFKLDDGRSVERDFSLVCGPAYSRVWRDPKKFRKVKIVGGTPTWPDNVEFCPDAVLRGGTKGRVPKSATIGTGGHLISSKPVRNLVARRSHTHLR